MIMGSDKARLSKRHGATSVMAYKEMGYLPEAVVNYLVRLGWSYGDQEIFSLDELIRTFTLESVGKSAAVFNPEKLLWLNQHYIKECASERLVEETMPFWQKLRVDTSDRDLLKHIADDLKTRSKTLAELADASLFYFTDDVVYEKAAADKFLTKELADHLAAIAERLPSVQDFTKKGMEDFLRAIAGERGVSLKVIAQPLRVALTGKTVSPGVDEIMVTLGKDRVAKQDQQGPCLHKGQGMIS